LPQPNRKICCHSFKLAFCKYKYKLNVFRKGEEMEECFVLLQDKTALDDGEVWFFSAKWFLHPDGHTSEIKAIVIDPINNTETEYKESLSIADIQEMLSNGMYAPIIVEMGNIPQNN